MDLDPDKVRVESVSKNFEYEKISREIDTCQDLEQLKLLAKCLVKLQLKQQEVVRKQFSMFLNDNFSSML